MSEDLLRKLRILEADYAGQPLIVQQVDLREINQIRSRLGMPLVDHQLNAIGAPQNESKPKPGKVRDHKVARDHTEAREIYQAHLKKVEELEVHRAYAERVVKATGGPGPTPVRPLATMGTGGGPLLCDHCRKPIVLEGGAFHGVTADAAWKKDPHGNWTSWILGGMVVEIQTNGTLRIYHGYPGHNNRHCCNVASREDKRAREEFKSDMSPAKQNALLAFIEDAFPDLTKDGHLNLLNEILDTMYSYDPGIGINRPGEC
jgi:hypothetical protein